MCQERKVPSCDLLETHPKLLRGLENSYTSLSIMGDSKSVTCSGPQVKLCTRVPARRGEGRESQSQRVERVRLPRPLGVSSTGKPNIGRHLF